jgi:nucleoside-diphosphate kinase
MERTCIIIKPDGVKRNLIGEIIKRLEKEGLSVRAIKMINAEIETLRRHYSAHIDKHFYQGLEAYLIEGPIVAMVFEGSESIEKARDLIGHTDPSQAKKGTIRGDLGKDSLERADREKRSVRNLIHASGTKEEAESEIGLWFKKEEILE